MVKKSYVMPVSNETRTRLRTTLLAGSIGGNQLKPADGAPSTQTDADGEETFVPARQRSVSSVD